MGDIQHHTLHDGTALDVDQVGVADHRVAARYRLPLASTGEEFEIILYLARVELEDVIQKLHCVYLGVIPERGGHLAVPHAGGHRHLLAARRGGGQCLARFQFPDSLGELLLGDNA